MNYFTSDLHFGSDEILVRENRPFKNISAFQEYCFILWSQQLTEKDYNNRYAGRTSYYG